MTINYSKSLKDLELEEEKNEGWTSASLNKTTTMTWLKRAHTLIDPSRGPNQEDQFLDKLD